MHEKSDQIIDINEIVQQLQSQKNIPRWVFASSGTIRSIAYGIPEAYGPRGRWIYKIFKLFGTSFAGIQALSIIGICVTVFWWFRAQLVPVANKSAVDLFVGFGAGLEQQMFEQFQNEGQRGIAYLDQTDPNSLCRLARPKLRRLIYYSLTESKIALNSLNLSTTKYVQNYLRQWATSVGIRFSLYVFTKAWADILPPTVQRIIYISADVPAFAAIDAWQGKRNINIEFRQHGLLRKSLIIPKFHKMKALSLPEKVHLESTNPSAQVELYMDNINKKSINYKKRVLFASIYNIQEFDKKHYLQLLNEMFQWIHQQGLDIMIRPHPREEVDFWPNNFPGIHVDKMNKDFSICLEYWEPLFVVSWFSTALLEALKLGILPILLMHGSKGTLSDLIFPLDEIALCWPRDREICMSLIKNPVLYEKELRIRLINSVGSAE